ncbi:hypothetical protein NEOLEDRAFT_593368 [Neolentinus lepideus HHB14362 ss-1]|uniref:Cleavage and polyadenylation specificity factor subunit 2 n=1 Tax=Neolentinus lepideus HHB14362 ss-1 TaxID=1314782 RepID=A0A165V938_9AGAM|nr:hypothetical protein NEOLEDRAFT_593368 [Neolentinus lepideus HHB14362 ss-1]
MITFKPLSGAARSSKTVPLAYLLQVDDVRILLDCGSPDWCPEASSSAVKTEDIDERVYHWEQYCDALKECAPSIDLVLLSHGDLAHSGFYAYAYSRWGLKAPAYTTLPVQAMGRVAAAEDVDGVRDEEDVGDNLDKQEGEDNAMDMTADSELLKEKNGKKYIASVQEVHEAFDSINVLRYSQPCHLQGKCQGLTITPFNAGHSLGGTIWKIRSPSAGTILYAVDMNHMKERHLEGTVLMRQAAGGVFEPLARPDLLITDAERANVLSSRRKDRDAALIDTITTTLSSRHSVLMPCDSSTRVLELLVLLDQAWNYSRLKFPICFLSRTGREMLTFVRSMMEWLGGTVNREDVGEDGTSKSQHQNKRKRGDEDGDDDALGAFALRHLEIFPSPQHLMQTYSSKDPKLILAVPASLSHGPSRVIFSDFAAIPDNVVLLTGRSEEGTLGRILFDMWNNAQRVDDKWDRGKIGSNIMMDGVLQLKMNSKVPLQGSELEEFLQKQRAIQEKEAAQQAAMQRTQRLLEADEDDSDDEDSDEEDENEVALALGDEMDTGGDLQGLTNGLVEPGSGGRGKLNQGGDADWALDADEGFTKHLSFDIYLKGNVSKATSFFKKDGGQSQRFRMFPYVEKKRRVDEYGETIDVGMWLRRSKVFEEEDASEDGKRKQTEESSKKAPPEPPSKFVTTQIEVQLACRLLFIDLEGLNDGRAVKTIVPQVNPRKMIIVHAREDSADELIDACGNIRVMTKDIFAPAAFETVQIGQQTQSFSISLSEELLASTKLSRFEDNEVGYVTGRVTIHAGSTIPTLEPASIATPTRSYSAKRLVAAGRGTLGARPPITLPHSTMIGELKLTALKSRLTSVGIAAELVGEGVLMCGKRKGSGRADNALGMEDMVAVRKTGRGKVELEGSASEVYYTVRKEIYGLHALVAA